MVLIIGEAGIGKSRLVHRFRETIRGTSHTWVDAAAGAFFQNTPFYPVTEMLRQMVWEQSLNRLDNYLYELQNPGGPRAVPDELFARLQSGLALAGLKPDEAVPLFAPLLKLPLPANCPPSRLLPEQQRRRLLATLVEWILGTARIQPLIIATEDLHWIDPSTLELIQLLVDQGNAAPLMLIYTARPEFRPAWPTRSHHTQINLDRLSARDVRTLIAQVAAQKALAAETIAAVVERTGGVPLFVEELTRALLERGDARLAWREIPATLHDSLIARLDRLGPARETLQLGAVLGGDFSYEFLQAVHPSSDHDELQRHLRTLTDAELLYVRGLAPDATYQFKHALIRDAAYEALLKSRRKELHRLVAQTIDSQFPALKDRQPEVLAYHWTEAGELEPAVMEWARAAKSAESRNAFKEALDNYQQAIVWLRLLPDSPQRDSRELELRQSAFILLRVVKGFSAPETMAAIEDATALAEKSGSVRQLGDWMMSRCLPAYTAGNLSAAEMYTDQALALTLRDRDPSRLPHIHTLQMLIRYWRGDFIGCERHFQAGLPYFDDPDFQQSVRGGAVVSFGAASWNAWQLGHANAARDRFSRMSAAVKGNKPQNIAFSEYSASYLQDLAREYELAEASAERALDLAEKHQFIYFASLARCVRGHALAQLGRVSEGGAMLRQGIKELRETGALLSITRQTICLALALEREGAFAEAIEIMGQALQANTEELAYKPEMLRVRGDLNRKLGLAGLAESDFREAIALAQKMSAKAWELRATTSLARLICDTGRHDEARTTLADIYNWFTEGFDTPDLKDAKALLDELRI